MFIKKYIVVLTVISNTQSVKEINSVPVCWQFCAFSCCYHFKIILIWVEENSFCFSSKWLLSSCSSVWCVPRRKKLKELT